MEWHLLRDSHFLVLSLGSSLTLVCMLNFYHLLPIVAASSSSSSAAGLLAVVSAVDLFSRFFTAWLGDWKVKCFYRFVMEKQWVKFRPHKGGESDAEEAAEGHLRPLRPRHWSDHDK